MPGVYIHIPFCKQACSYCNFHFSTNLSLKKKLVKSICEELRLQADFLPDKLLTSVYFGGGTPSLLDEEDLEKIFESLRQHFKWDDATEITLEANPDDITDDTCKLWKKAGINRLSIGIQSFSEEELIFMNRAHNVKQAENSIKTAQNNGLTNLTCDLIYGVPGSTLKSLEKNIKILTDKGIPHISAYALTVENKTLLSHQIKNKIVSAPDDKMTELQYIFLMRALESFGFEHYEISNFALPGNMAIHNTSYWKGESYIGIGPSAHSYHQNTRFWNVSNNALYIKSIEQGITPFEKEILSKADRYNEYIMTGLRTSFGVLLEKIATIDEEFSNYFVQQVKKHKDSGFVLEKNKVFTLSQKGKLFADRIASDLFWVET
jgi:oxygen-independent coproporphyrinogen-3 oxidase